MRPHRAADPQRGSATTELVLVTPLLILLTLVAVALGRLAGARLDADEAAHQAARAASLARSAGQARGQAERAATLSLAAAGSTCTRPETAPALGRFAPGSVVTVKVTCHVVLGTPGLPGEIAISASAASVVDTYRGVQA